MAIVVIMNPADSLGIAQSIDARSSDYSRLHEKNRFVHFELDRGRHAEASLWILAAVTISVSPRDATVMKIA